MIKGTWPPPPPEPERALGEIEGRLSGGDWLWTRWWKRFSRLGHLRRLAALPATERAAHGVVVGRARLVGPAVQASYTGEACIAYWSRSHDDTENSTLARRSKITDLAVDGDDGTTVSIRGDDAIAIAHVRELRLVDRRSGLLFQLTTIVPGDRVIVWGQLEGTGEGTPYRQALQMRRRGKKPIWVGLAEPPAAPRR